MIRHHDNRLNQATLRQNEKLLKVKNKQTSKRFLVKMIVEHVITWRYSGIKDLQENREMLLWRSISAVWIFKLPTMRVGLCYLTTLMCLGWSLSLLAPPTYSWQLVRISHECWSCPHWNDGNTGIPGEIQHVGIIPRFILPVLQNQTSAFQLLCREPSATLLTSHLLRRVGCVASVLCRSSLHRSAVVASPRLDDL